MRTARLHVEGPLCGGEEVELPAAASSHIARVLRLQPGDPLTLFDGRGGEYEAHIAAVGRHAVRCRVGVHRAIEREPALRVTLVQGISRGERMDYTIQKAVELGVASIAPVFTARSTVRLDAQRAATRHRHWLGVIAAACEQSGRNRLPALSPPRDLAEELAAPADGVRLLMDPGAALGIGALPDPGGAVTLLVGPEGGLADEEIDAARAHGYACVHIGPRTLRTETAALAALAALQARWGDFA
ncbi:MAG: 16S rRNA (uracil(1498)-N(3))-methyltransferase [Gammaproteobacteria bacterium]